jgi:hypothetical protein
MSLHEDVNSLETHQTSKRRNLSTWTNKIRDKITEENALLVSRNVRLNNILAHFKFKVESYFTDFLEEVNCGFKRNGNIIINTKQGFRNWRPYVIFSYYVGIISLF